MTGGRAWRFGSNVDTDALAPGAYMQFGIAEIAKHCLSTLRPEFAAQVKSGDFVVADENFGIGSSREQAAQALCQLGVRAVIAPSYSGLFFRNAFNVGLLLISCPEVRKIKDQDQLTLQLTSQPTIRLGDQQTLACEAIPDFLLEMVNAGGLLSMLKEKKHGRA